MVYTIGGEPFWITIANAHALRDCRARLAHRDRDNGDPDDHPHAVPNPDAPSANVTHTNSNPNPADEERPTD